MSDVASKPDARSTLSCCSQQCCSEEAPWLESASSNRRKRKVLQLTPSLAENFFGVEPTGRSFKTISLDMFTVKNGKLSSAYHVENWAGAMAQVKGQ